MHRTLANLSKLPPGLIDLVERYCAAERAGDTLELSAASVPVIGPAYGPLAALLALARECGIEKALGKTRIGRLSLFLVLARVLHRGSRRSAARWASTQATAPILGLEHFDEEDLYRALDWLEAEHLRVERALAPKRPNGAKFLSDVTSSYLEGQQNELAAPGCDRDGKRFKKQVVVGLLTDAAGEPVSVHVYEGNRADPTTVPDRGQWLAKDLGAEHFVLVGDRGTLKGSAREVPGQHDFHYVTALTDPKLRRRLNEGALPPGLFTEEVAEVVGEDGVRYVLRRTPATMERHRSRCADQLARVRTKVDARNAFMDAHPRTDAAVSLRQTQRWIQAYKLGGFVSARAKGRPVVLDVDGAKRERKEELDGCYAVITDVPRSDATAQEVWERYGGLQRVERDFRTMKTGLLELRPISCGRPGGPARTRSWRCWR